jgi:hypothetical protein
LTPFIVLSLPRSRSAWLSRFLTYGDWSCGHEELRHMRSLDDVRAWFTQPCTGSAETAAAPWWRLLGEVAPGAKIVVIRRPPAEVVESLLHIPGLAFDRAQLERTIAQLDRKLGQIEKRLPGVMSVPFHDLANEDACAAIFEHCLPYEHNHERWKTLSALNIQISLPALFRYYAAYQPALEKLAKIAKHKTIAQMRPGPIALPDGLTIQTEDFETWRRDGRPLFEEHCILVGEAPGEWSAKNIPLMRRFDEMGVLQIMTARCNGRMFGYLMTLISPSLADPDLTTGTNTTFFASPQFPGLGLKLQRAAIETLKARGVGELFMQAGVRGSGERIASIYRRLGAENSGQMFRLDLLEN